MLGELQELAIGTSDPFVNSLRPFLVGVLFHMRWMRKKSSRKSYIGAALPRAEQAQWSTVRTKPLRSAMRGLAQLYVGTPSLLS
ncbi:unnamed protein product [Merluccius merluccius]